MQFVYRPDGAERRWDFDPMKLMNAEAEVIERRTGMMYGDWSSQVTQGSMLALHGLLFVMLKREEPTLKWDEVQFNLSMVDFEVDDQEEAELLGQLQARVDAGEELEEAELTLLAQLRDKVPAETPADPTEPVVEHHPECNDRCDGDVHYLEGDAEAPKAGVS